MTDADKTTRTANEARQEWADVARARLSQRSHDADRYQWLRHKGLVDDKAIDAEMDREQSK